MLRQMSHFQIILFAASDPGHCHGLGGEAVKERVTGLADWAR